MKKPLFALYLICVLMAVVKVQATDNPKDINSPIPETVKKLVAGSRTLIERDRLTEANLSLKKAISIAPNYVNAHAEYIWLQSNFFNRSDAVRKEYEDLMKKEPNNPVYPMALAIGSFQVSETSKKVWLQRVVDVAPDWSWAHYARALLIVEKEPEAAVAELKKYVETEGSWGLAYYTLSYIQGTTLKRLDDAIETSEKMAALPDSRSWDLNYLWKLRLGKAGGTEQAKTELRNELGRLVASSRDVKKLDAARLAYNDLLEDKEQALRVENKIRRIEPAWYPERGRFISISARNVSGISRRVIAPNRQFANFNKIDEFSGEIEPERKIPGLEQLLSLKLSPELKHYLYERIFEAAVKIKDTNALVKYGELLFAADPNDVAIPSRIATALADKKNIQAALRYAKIAERATATFRPIPRPANNGKTDEEWNKEFSEEQQRKFYQRMRSLALDALGWSHFQAGNLALAEINLKQSIELNRAERNLSHFSKALDGLGRKAEAEETAKEAKNLYAKNLKQAFRNEPAKDFELTTLNGRKVKLSELKGKVVMIDFWATWCGPCVQSIPTLNKLYEKYKNQGLEILYVSTDSEADKYKVAPFVKEKSISFPVMLDAGVKEMYDVKAFPTTIFIDRKGNIRHRDTGFVTDESPRMIETAIELLLQVE
jgi:thiol-disulfide isomerase/thioredoxin